MVQTDETGHTEILVPLCHWCDEPLDGKGQNGMHNRCAEECHEATERGYDQLAAGWVGTTK